MMRNPKPPDPDVPPAAEKCFTCFLAGHYCRATVYWFEVAVCAACVEGQLCEQQKSVARMLGYGRTGYEYVA